jgi:nitrogen fixation/metabolism regulation signal transduction histidine kinase
VAKQKPIKKLRTSLGIRIYVSMIVLVVFSLLATGGATFYYFKGQNERMHLERLQRQEHSIMLSLNYYIIENNIQSVNAKLENKINELSDIHNLDLNVFNNNGQLIGSTNLNIFESEDRPLQLPASVIQNLNTSDDRIVLTEEVKGQEYLSTYFYLVTSDNRNLAIVNLPYLKSERRSEQDLLSFLFTLAQVYIVLFIIAAVAAYFLSNYITNTLATIRKKLQAFSMDSTNEKLEWNSNDEIGALVQTYNLMVDELHRSAEKLAKSERESAWKEMAKQVAHEIKNPLTPMRLSIQHLQRTLKDRPEEADVILKRFSNTMIEQIDTLSRIATEFSNFAKMPRATMAELNLREILSSVKELYEPKQSNALRIEFIDEVHTDPTIWADKEQMLRVFGNLVKNAIQAIPEDKNGLVELLLTEEDNRWLVAVKDNGNGIPEEMLDKIFTPSFTTKSSGMGLGLAMVKSILSEANAQIHFETEERKGTSFYISFPKHSNTSPPKD